MSEAVKVFFDRLGRDPILCNAHGDSFYIHRLELFVSEYGFQSKLRFQATKKMPNGRWWTSGTVVLSHHEIYEMNSKHRIMIHLFRAVNQQYKQEVNLESDASTNKPAGDADG